MLTRQHIFKRSSGTSNKMIQSKAVRLLLVGKQQQLHLRQLQQRLSVHSLASKETLSSYPSIKKNMKLSTSCLWGLFFSTTTTNGLPFTRGEKKKDQVDETQGTVEAVVVHDGDIISVTRHTTRRSAVADQFFASGDDDYEAASQSLLNEVRALISNQTNFLVSTRRTLHRRPELMYQEKETSSIVQKVLTEMDISFTTGWAVNANPDIVPGPGGYGVVADIGTGGDPCVLLRADMDALPIHELTEGIDEFKSQTDNTMHACSHDGHTSMLLGAAAILKSMEDSIPGTVRIMFQPAEEGGAGAKRMREEGVLQKEPKPQHAFGMHMWPTLPSGTIAGRAGPILAACERFEILIAGVGGHAAMPHLTIDPIVTASAIVMNLQSIVSRSISPLESGVCSITKIDGGDAFNVIPASVLMRGTIRALSTETLMSLRDRVQHIVETTAATYGANTTITYSPDFYPPTVNDPALYEQFSKSVGALVADNGQVLETEPTMGAEDFSFVAEAIPSTFFMLGQGSGKNPPTNFGLHHPRFAMDESVMPKGVELHVNLALRALRKIHNGEPVEPIVA